MLGRAFPCSLVLISAISLTTVVGLAGCDDDSGSGGTEDAGGDGDGDGDADGGDGDGDGDCEPFEFESYGELQALFADNCVDGCHEAGGTAETLYSVDLYLDEGNSYEALLGTDGMGAQSVASTLLRVNPGDHTTSFLWHKVNGTQVTSAAQPVDNKVNDRMPSADGDTPPPPLDQCTIDAIAAWIDAGASMD